MALGLLFGACTNNTTSPTSTTSPNTPTIKLVGLNLSRVETMLQVGQTQTYQLSNSPSTTVVIWTSSDPSVLSIDEGGAATGHSNGRVTLAATSDTGQTAMLTVQVVPVYQGQWTGTITTTGCTEFGGFAVINYWSQVVGTTQVVVMNLNQVNSNTGNISGTMSKSEAGNTVSGSLQSGIIDSEGNLAGLTGSLAGFANGVDLTIALTSWNSFASGSRMMGAWSGRITSSQILGAAGVQYSLTNVVLVPPTTDS